MLWLGLLFATISTLCAAADGPKRVLILNPFGRDVEPFSAAVSRFRTTLMGELGKPVDFYEIPLDLARFTGPEGDAPLVDFLEDRIKSQPVDLVVPIGGAGVRFLEKNATLVSQRIDVAEIGVQGARTALRILRGEGAARIPPQILDAAKPAYDWRELQRWNISEAKLPPGSIIRFRQPSFWEQHRNLIAGVIALGLFQAVLIIGLLVNRNERRRGEAEATMIADISSKFVNLPADQVDDQIFDAQRRICELMEIDLAALWQRTERHPGSFTATHLYSLVHGPQLAGEMTDDDFPWIRQEILAGRVVAHRSLADMPAAAAMDRGAGRKLGIKSHLTLPLSLGGESPIGILGFNTTRKERAWPSPMIERLKLVAEIFANALARKEADQALRESETRMTLAAEAAKFGVWVWTIADNEVWGSDRWRQMFGFVAGEDVSLEKVIQRIHPDERETVEREMRHALAKHEDFAGEFRIILPDGTQRWVTSQGRVELDANGTPARMLGAAVDITERRNTEIETRDLRNALAHSGRVTLLGNLASSLAHELSQPLGAILRNAEAAEIMLRDPAPDIPELQEIIADILHDDQRAGQVIDHLRSLLKHGTIDPVPVDLRELIESVIAIVKTDAAARLVKITTNLQTGMPNALGDGIHLQQVLLNLIINAMDALHDCGSDDRTLHVQAHMEGADMIEIHVSDNGPGIPEENLNRLFEPFFTTKATGMGMGLPVCKTIVEAHKGRLRVAKNPGGGTRFSFTVPAAGHTHHP